MAKVVNYNVESYDVLIDRRTKWGNPFIIGRDGDRTEVIDKYRQWIRVNKELKGMLHELKGKRLGCCCKPKACHGDVLVEMVEAQEMMEMFQ